MRPLYESMSISNDGKQIEEVYLIDIIAKEIGRIRNELKMNEEKLQSIQKENEKMKKDLNSLQSEHGKASFYDHWLISSYAKI